MTVADDAIIEAENQVNFNWARTLPSHRAATHTMYALALGSPAYIKRKNTRISQRNEIAYLYHWKSRNLLPPLRINQRK